METKRKMQIVVNQVKMEDEDILDVSFWLSKTSSERLAEVFRLRRNYFTSINGYFPNRMEKVVSFRKLKDYL